MSIRYNLTEFAGLPVADFADGDPPPEGPVAWRVRSSFDGAPFGEVFENFLTTADTAAVTHLVIGYWGASYDKSAADPAALLTAAAGRLPALRALFLGDIVGEESEISWIEQSDLSPLLAAFPALEHLVVRGSAGLELTPFTSGSLKVLRFESGGLPAGIVRAVAASDLPALEHLDLFLGVEEYLGDASVDDLAPILSGERLPALRRLGLEDSEIQDEIAAAVAAAPVVARLTTLSLAMGTLTDEGAEALLSGQPLTHLEKLDLHHHYLSDQMMQRVRDALPGVEVNLGDQEEPDFDDDETWLYVAVSE